MAVSESKPDRDGVLDIVDLERFPIQNLDTGMGAELVERLRQQLDTQGWCNLTGFIRAEVLEALVAEVRELMPQAHPRTIVRNIYGEAADSSVPEGHPARRETVHHALFLADDQLPAHTLIQRLYRSDLMTEFVRRVQGKERLYRYADPFQALNVVTLPPGSWHAWHYDHSECTVTLLLQAAESGGEFTFIPNTRDENSEDLEVVERFLAGDRSESITLDRGAGALTLFRGGYSLHGVTEVEGDLPRMTAVLTYDEQPGREASEEINWRIYGDRVREVYKTAAGRGR